MRYLTARTYEWVVEGDIEACFDEISHTRLMDRVRDRVGDKRVVALVKASLKAGILVEGGSVKESRTGTRRAEFFRPCSPTLPCRCSTNISLRRQEGRPPLPLLHQLNSLLRGWTTYFRRVHVAAGRGLVAPQTPPNELEGTPPPLLRWRMVARHR